MRRLIKRYHKTNKQTNNLIFFSIKVAQACLKSLSRHGWSLNERLSVLALFDDSLPDDVRANAARALHMTSKPDSMQPGKPKLPDVTKKEFWQDCVEGKELDCLARLIGPESWFIPQLLGLSDEDMVWLQLRVDEWMILPGYKRMKAFIEGLSVTNDCAERGVALIQNFVNSTTDESLRQDLVLAVQEHRERYPTKRLTKDLLSNVVWGPKNKNN